MPLLSRRRTSSEPSFRTFRVLKGTDFAPFVTRHRRCAPEAEKQDPAVHGEEPAVGEVQLPRPEVLFQFVGQGVLPVEVAADDGGGQRRVAACSRPTSLSSGFAPGAGTPNASARPGR